MQHPATYNTSDIPVKYTAATLVKAQTSEASNGSPCAASDKLLVVSCNAQASLSLNPLFGNRVTSWVVVSVFPGGRDTRSPGVRERLRALWPYKQPKHINTGVAREPKNLVEQLLAAEGRCLVHAVAWEALLCDCSFYCPIDKCQNASATASQTATHHLHEANMSKFHVMTISMTNQPLVQSTASASTVLHRLSSCALSEQPIYNSQLIASGA